MIGDALYFHGSSQGEKMDDIRRDPRVVFEIDEEAGYVRPNDPETPCKASFHFRSAIIRGRGVIVEDETERVKALNGLMQKYQPDGAYDPVTSGMAAGTAVVRIDIESLTGKIAL
jgi:hypothetical protein